MKQYLNLLETIKSNGVVKTPARQGMPSTQSLFGYQFRHNLKDGFPLLTTKKINFQNIVVELMWFLRGDTNIKYLLDNNCNIWNEDAYNYYLKLYKKEGSKIEDAISFESFIEIIKSSRKEDLYVSEDYHFGDCGYQYGKVWRNWETINFDKSSEDSEDFIKIDQIKNLIIGLKNNPQSRRHILTSIDPTHENELALYWCHALSQFNCRELTQQERTIIYFEKLGYIEYPCEKEIEFLDENNIPKYYLDCQMYQRSADVFLGVPYNISSYALLTEILCKICNMIPGEMIYSYGDVHIYENHKEQVEEQLSRIPTALPKLKFNYSFDNHIMQWSIGDVWKTSEMISCLDINWFSIEDYNPQPSIKGKLSTGLQ